MTVSRCSLAARHEPVGTLVGQQLRPWAGGLRRAVDLILTWHDRARQRRHLQCLSDRMLRDIGLTRADIQAEASKPFWRL